MAFRNNNSNNNQFNGSHLLFGSGDAHNTNENHFQQPDGFVVTETTTSRMNRRGDVRTTTTTTYSPTTQQAPRGGNFPVGGFPHQLVTQMVGQNGGGGGSGEEDDAPCERAQLVLEVCTNTTMSSGDGCPAGGKKKRRAFKERKRQNRRKEEFLLASAGSILQLGPRATFMSLSGAGTNNHQQQNPQVIELIQMAPTASAAAPRGAAAHQGGGSKREKKNKRLAKKCLTDSSSALNASRKKCFGAPPSGPTLGPSRPSAQPEDLMISLQYQHEQGGCEQQQQKQCYGNRGRGRVGRSYLPSSGDEDEHLHFDAPFETPHLSPKPSPQAMPVLVALPSSVAFGRDATDEFVELDTEDLFEALVI